MNFALVLSGGIGARMEIKDCPKQYLEAGGKPIVVHTLEKLEANADTNAIVVVAAQQWQVPLRQWMKQYRISRFLAFALPGITRQESILHGLDVCARYQEGESDVVLIHDAVRPLVSDSLLSRCYAVAREFGGCMPTLPVYDTTYQSTDGSTIERLLDRDTLFRGQAPEAYQLKPYWEMNRSVSREELNSYHGSSEIAFRHHLYESISVAQCREFEF